MSATPTRASRAYVDASAPSARTSVANLPTNGHVVAAEESAQTAATATAAKSGAPERRASA
ncbi:MAG: hypothetical protein KF782_14010 [Labilithrix sp.]|nr:hypothetical protein [Labilithrix sp.]